MRSVEDAQKWWSRLDDHLPLDRFRDIIDAPYDSNSLAEKWPNLIHTSRDAYDILKDKYISPLRYPDELESDSDPLSDVDNSPWNILRNDEIRRQEIFQDVERCMPDHLYFREPSTQHMLLDILFIWTKLNPDVGYRQGMHEILAPILWVVERDAIDPSSIIKNSAGVKYFNVMEDVFDFHHIEHDTFTLFNIIMQNMKSFYEAGTHPSPVKSQGQPPQVETPVLKLSKNIVDIVLQRTDPSLADHLGGIGVAPQVYLMLLFGREFPFDEVLHLWDCIFTRDPMLKSIDLICVAMMLRIRWQLIEADQKNALTLLFKYPELGQEHGPWTLVGDALHLKGDLTPNAGAFLVTKYTDRCPPYVEQSRISTSSRSSPGKTSFSSSSNNTSIATSTQPSGGIESMLQDAARGVYSQSERWGVNKAVREAVGEVRKNVKDLQARHSRNSSYAGFSQSENASDLLQRIDDLKARNETLARMLESAVGELWKHEGKISIENSSQQQSVKEFTMAVAKVQFVQIYLKDSTLPLPNDEKQQSSVDDNKDSQSSEDTMKIANDLQGTPPPPITIPKTIDSPQPKACLAFSEVEQNRGSRTEKPKNEPPALNLLSDKPKPSSEYPKSPTRPLKSAPPAQMAHAKMADEAQFNSKIQRKHQDSTSSRPSLAQSSFSFMLGQEKSTFLTAASPFTMDTQTFERRQKNSNAETAFLFGLGNAEDDANQSSDLFGRREKGNSLSTGIDGLTAKVNTTRRGSKPKDDSKDDEAFHLSTWRS